MADPHRNMCGVVVQAVNTIWYDYGRRIHQIFRYKRASIWIYFPESKAEIVVKYSSRTLPGTIFSAAIYEITHLFFCLGVYGNNHPSLMHAAADPAFDSPKLVISHGMWCPNLLTFQVLLKGVPHSS